MKRLTILTMCLGAGWAVSACAASSVEPMSTNQPSLLIQGYNYTDQDIDSFTVNGIGGGNVHISTPSSGGGGSTCCYRFDGLSSQSVTIRWTASYCSYATTNKYGETHTWRKSLWREEKVPVAIKELSEPKALEVHFYPDGHLEAVVTSGYSPPRLKLPITADKQRPGVSRSYPLCSHEHLDQVH